MGEAARIHASGAAAERLRSASRGKDHKLLHRASVGKTECADYHIQAEPLRFARLWLQICRS